MKEEIKESTEEVSIKMEAEKNIGTSLSVPSSIPSFYNPQEEIAKLRQDNKEEIQKVNKILVGLVIFTALTFITEIYTMNLDRIKDKDLYLRYNDVFKSYVEENIKLRDAMNNQKIESNNLQNEFELLKAKNPYLK
ncbi:MAG: hypothetical protein PHR47_01095 [Candidatus Pacebacteria bacterium]|nr:hypothetical protein [Candidatus Paceibacterota bacterium]